MKVDTTIMESLLNIYNQDLGLVNAYARNLLIASGKISYTEPIIFPEGELKSSKRDKYRGVKSPDNDMPLKLYPNPSRTHFIAEYHLDGKPGECHLEIAEISGKILRTIQLSGKEGQKVISVDNLISGIYIVKLFVNGGSIQNTKISIIK